MTGRRRRARGKLSPGKTACLNARESAIQYHAVVMTVMRGRGRSGHRVTLCPSGYASVVE